MGKEAERHGRKRREPFPRGQRTLRPQTAEERKQENGAVSDVTLYPLRFEPIYQYRLWGGRRLADVLTAPLPGKGPIGEAWLLSDRDEQQSLVAD